MSTTTRTKNPTDALVNGGESNLPEGWVPVALGDAIVTEVQTGFACGINNREGKGIGHLRPMNVNADGEIDLTDLKYVPESECDRDERLVRMGDVIFNNTNSTELVGKTAYYGLSEPRTFSNHMTRVRCCSDVLNPQFCSLALHQLWRAGYFQGVCNQHVSQSSVSRSVLLETEITLPPLPEQERIVLKTEELTIQVNASRDHLANVEKILKRFRQSVLDAACSGRLTEDWREQHKEVETAGNLIARIRTDRRAQWEAREVARLRSKGVVLRGDKWKERYVEPVDPEIDESPELPPTWCLTGLEILLSTTRRGMKTGPFGSSLKKAEHQTSGIPVLGIENIGEMTFIEGSKIHISRHKAKELAEFDALPGDILISRSGTVGEVCVVPQGLGEARISTNIMRLSLGDKGILPTYFCYLFNGSPFVLNQVSHLCGGSTRDFLNQEILRSILFPLPPPEEQQEIVCRVDALFKLADMIEKRVEAATKRAEKLTQAILAKAFRGELVPTEAELARREGRDYEHASVLLERIRAEREMVAAADNRRRRRPRAAKKK